MLSDALFDIKANLEQRLYHYTTGFFKNTYDTETIQRVQSIIDLMGRAVDDMDSAMFEELDT